MNWRNWPVMVLAGLALLCLCEPLFAGLLGHSATDSDLLRRLAPPSGQFWLGADELGRDVFLRLLAGGKISLLTALCAASLSALIGTTVGIIAGYRGGFIDALLMRLSDFLLSLPALPLLIILSAIDAQKLGLGADAAASPWLSLYKIILLIALFGWVGIARLVRARTLSLRAQDFVTAARALGLGPTRIMLRHILPNVVSIVIVAASLAAGGVILTESVLSFLGLGIQPPLASWGNMLSQAEETMWENISLSLYPGLMIFVTVLALNCLGDRLRQQLNPHKQNLQPGRFLD